MKARRRLPERRGSRDGGPRGRVGINSNEPPDSWPMEQNAVAVARVILFDEAPRCGAAAHDQSMRSSVRLQDCSTVPQGFERVFVLCPQPKAFESAIILVQDTNRGCQYDNVDSGCLARRKPIKSTKDATATQKAVSHIRII